jgi:hypothetical protein
MQPDHYDVEVNPSTHLIEAIRAEGSDFHQWAGEAMDNSFDAGATKVALIMNAGELTCWDNGNGITKEHDDAVVGISVHGPMTGTKLGRYGVGIKAKAIQHGKTIRFESVSKDGRMVRSWDWNRVSALGRWCYPRAARTPASSSARTYTRVEILDLLYKPTDRNITKTINIIQRMFYPALLSGCSITLNGADILPISAPAMTDVVEGTVDLGEGKKARVVAGMLVEQKSQLRQVDVTYEWRVIKKESAFACDGFAGITAMYCRVTLEGNWGLAKFKDDLFDKSEYELLEEAVAEIIIPVLEKCHSASMKLKTHRVTQLLNEMVPDHLKISRPVKKDPQGRQGPKRGDKRVKPAPDTDPTPTGPTSGRRPPRGILIEFSDGLHETEGFGRALIEKKSARIQLASDNPHISKLRSGRDEELCVIALYDIAMLLYEGKNSEQLMFDMGDTDHLGLRAWKKVADHYQAAEAAE